MAKVIGQAIPPTLAALYAAIAGPGKVIQGPNGTMRMKPGVKHPKKKPRRNLPLIGFQTIAGIVAKEYFTDKGQAIPPNFVYNMTQDLILGIFSPDYFVKCQVESAITLQSVPTYTTDPAPPPYAFRDNAFLPTKPTYPDGTPTAAAPIYTGQKIGTVFADTLLRWRKIVFKAESASKPKGEQRTLIKWETRIDITATSRGSRPMLSLNLAASLSPATSGAVSSTAPPIMKKTIFYWRFEVPPSSPPFYTSFQIKKDVRPGARIIKKTGTAPYARYVLNAANRPMMGRGFNNNDAVQTSFVTDPELWEIKPDCRACDWTERASAADNGWLSIVWSPFRGLFVAVALTGTGNRVMTSPDGVNWTGRTSAADNQWRGIVWSPELGLLVAVALTGTGNRVMTSPDGVNWTTRTTPVDNDWTSIAWSPELGLFAAVAASGTGNRVMTSPDGVNWTARASAADNEWESIVWSAALGLYVAVAASGTGNRVMTSPDGVNWTTRASAANNAWFGLAWSAALGLLVAVGASGTGNRVMTSPDGVNWTTRASAADNAWIGIVWSPDLSLFVAVATSGTGNRVMTSPDAINWTGRTSAADNPWVSIAWSPQLGLFAAVSSIGSGNLVMTAP